MDFPLNDSTDEDACSGKLVELLHPDGLACPRCEQRHPGVHARHRAPVLGYRCGDRGRVFHAWTGTVFQGTHRRPSALLLILRGVAQGRPTAPMARELGGDREHLLELRHRLQGHARTGLDRNPLGDAVVEADEMDQNAGKKKGPARRPGRPAAAAGRPPPRPRQLRQRPAADRRGDRAGFGPGPLGGAGPRRRGGVGGDRGPAPLDGRAPGR